MKKLVYSLLVAVRLLVPEMATAKPELPANDHRSSFAWFTGEASVHLMRPYRATLAHLQQKQAKYKRMRPFMRHLFQYVHRKHLKQYQMYSPLTKVMEDGTYDCVSGTALYALILNGLGIPYRIWEMDYHVFLTVEVEGTTVVFESTDPVKGFIDQPKLVEEHRAMYEAAARRYQETAADVPLIYRPVTLAQLAGLQLYNRAIYAFQHQRTTEAKQYVGEALSYYPDERIARLATHIRRNSSGNNQRIN